jgi:glycerol-3-phosphate acyltransferase PlsX
MTETEKMANQPIRIAVDAMGGDHAPREIVRGAITGAREFGVTVLLVGNPDAIREELSKIDTQGADHKIIPATEVIEMNEGATAVRKKKDASINVTSRCVKEGEAQGMVAAGSTGAAMASATLYVGRISGIDRPAIGVQLPSLSKTCLLIDAGANAECTPEMLVQFAHMGNIYMHNVQNLAKPRVGLLNIGEEEGKGNAFANAAFKLLEEDPTLHFIGNVEGRDMFMGNTDVAVCDGFTGNVALKSAEGVMRMFKNVLKTEIKRSVLSQMGALMAKPAFEMAGKKVDPEEVGGSLLLGIKGICVISHGGSKERGIKNAVRVAKEAIVADVLGKISNQIQLREGTMTHEPAH